MEPDDAGLQPQTGAEPGELREIDGGGGGESAAKRPKRGGTPFFPFVGSRNSGKRSHHRPTGIFHRRRKTSNLEKYFSFLLLTVNPAGSFHTASRLVRLHRAAHLPCLRISFTTNKIIKRGVITNISNKTPQTNVAIGPKFENSMPNAE